MDALALLCNLHADGPATLQRLRRSACDSLTALRRLDPARLASLLDWNERAAERFLREAALLCERVQEDEPGAEPSSAAGEHEFELESALIEELEDAPGEDESDDGEPEDETLAESDEESEADAPAFVAEQTAAVLEEWRELDRVSPPVDPADFVIPRPEPPPDRSLHGLVLEGLSPALRGRLAELGVHPRRELAQANELDLARAIPLGYTRLKRLQALAARELATLAAHPAAPAPTPALSPVFEAYAPPPSEFETAGPFA